MTIGSGNRGRRRIIYMKIVNGRPYNSMGSTIEFAEIDIDEITIAPEMISNKKINRIKKHTCRI
jgi:hypothetical protein